MFVVFVLGVCPVLLSVLCLLCAVVVAWPVPAFRRWVFFAVAVRVVWCVPAVLGVVCVAVAVSLWWWWLSRLLWRVWWFFFVGSPCRSVRVASCRVWAVWAFVRSFVLLLVFPPRSVVGR